MDFATCRCCFSEYIKHASKSTHCNVCEARRKRISFLVHDKQNPLPEKEKQIYKLILGASQNLRVSEIAFFTDMSSKVAKRHAEILVKKNIASKDSNGRYFI